MHFDTTRANILAQDAIPLDLIPDKFKNTQYIDSFKGNMCINKLEDFLRGFFRETTKQTLSIFENSAKYEAIILTNYN